MTNQPDARMPEHASNGKDTEGWFILGVHKTKAEAALSEFRRQAEGWGGARGRRILIDDTTYASQAHASLEIGISRELIKHRCNSKNYENYSYT